MTEVVVLNTDEAYKIDVTSISNVLTSGLYVKDAPQIVKGFVTADHTLALVTTAATVKALHIVYNASQDPDITVSYAIWPVYTQPEGQPEAFYGYLVITLADGTVASIDATNTLGNATIDAAVFGAACVDYYALETTPDPVDSDDVADSIDTAKTKVRFVAE